MGQTEVMTQVEAWNIYDRWLQDERIGFLDEPLEMEAAFRSVTQLRQAAPKDWADSYLAAFAVSAQLTLVTFDRGFSNKGGQIIVL